MGWFRIYLEVPRRPYVRVFRQLDKDIDQAYHHFRSLALRRYGEKMKNFDCVQVSTNSPELYTWLDNERKRLEEKARKTS